VLAQELREGDTIQTALQAYEARRRPRINWVQEQSLAAARAGGFLPRYVTVCFENTAIKRFASAMNRCAPNVERRTFSAEP
jgi:2-polyprenyl-6-methoxyphenol hydroxylase-like FAD-dependent oxidoreductase